MVQPAKHVLHAHTLPHLFLAPAAPMREMLFHIFNIWISLHLTIQIQFKGPLLWKAFPMLCPPPNLFSEPALDCCCAVRYSVVDCMAHGKS